MSRRFSLAFTIAGAFLLTASCGSRTGLFGSEPGSTIDPEAGTSTETSRPDAPPDGPVPCTPGKFEFELAAAQLMFVIDRSGSMAFSLDGQQPGPFGLPPGVPSRWQALRDAVFQTILPFDGSLAMGAKFYPEVAPRGAPVEEACGTDVGVAIAPARNNAASIVNVFDTTEPIGGTPTAEAIRLAAQYLTGTRGVARTLVVATDGAPNCNGNLDADRCTCTARRANGSFACDGPDGQYNCLDDLRSINTIKNIFDNQKIPVYVIGIGSTERPEFLKVLDDMAVAGGRARPTTPRHYNVQSASELKAALGSIQESVAKCTYLTPSAPTDPSAISVELDGKPVPRDVTQTNGWDWLDQAYGTLQFFGPSCEAASAAAKPTITGVVRCEPR